MARLRVGTGVSKDLNLHRLIITEEALTDYECLFDMDINAVLPNGLTIWQEIKQEFEFYMLHHRKLWHKHYFKVKELDPYTNEFIYIFIKPVGVDLCIHNWKVVGICLEKDWDERDEEKGIIRSWIDTSVNPKDDGDWVIDLQIRQIERVLERLYEEDRDEYERVITLFAEKQELDIGEVESNGISIKQLDKKHSRRVQRLKKQN